MINKNYCGWLKINLCTLGAARYTFDRIKGGHNAPHAFVHKSVNCNNVYLIVTLRLQGANPLCVAAEHCEW